jgi:hypothetical protein
MSDQKSKQIRRMRRAYALAFISIFAFVSLVSLITLFKVGNATTGDYAKSQNDILTASEWNNLLNDFVDVSGDTMTGGLNTTQICDENGTNCKDTEDDWGEWLEGNGDEIYYSAGFVGIGEGNPSSRLEVDGATSDNTEAALSVQNSSNNVIIHAQNDQNVGIGTDSVDSRLDIVGGNIDMNSNNIEDTTSYQFPNGFEIKQVSSTALTIYDEGSNAVLIID